MILATKTANKVPARVVTLAGILAAVLAGVCLPAVQPAALAQTSTSAPSVSTETIQETNQNQAKKSKVILSRSMDENGQVTDGPAADAPAQTQPAAKTPASAKPVPTQVPTPVLAPAQAASQLTLEDAERAALLYTDYDFDVRLRPAEGHLAVRALITVRNDSKAPLLHLPLQLSSTLDWELIRLNAHPMAFTTAVLNSDADHTGQLHEASITLPTPLAPGASLQLDVTYSGTILQTSKRLLAIGTPADIADHSDWDGIATDFTGLRGFGNVIWYPVSAVPVVLGDGARLFDEIGTQKLHAEGAHFRLALTVETPANQSPNVALVNGRPVPLTVTTPPDATVATIAAGRVEDTTLGFEAPSIFLAQRTSRAITNTTLWIRPESESNVAAWADAATQVTPFLQGWLGVRPRAELIVLELPDPADIPFETGALLVTPLRAAQPDVLQGVMAHALTHAWMISPQAWLSEGVAHFMGTLWTEKRDGRDRALATLESGRQSLALVEPESPGSGDGQPIVACISPVYYRTKAAYVFWMLRDLAGDAALSAALRAYDPKDTAPDAFEKLVEQAGQRRNLSSFFADWVYADKGLPELAIESVYSTPASVAGSYLVSVTLANNGYAGAEVPVEVISDLATVTQHVQLAARSKSVQRVVLQGMPTEVRANDGTIPETQATIHSRTLDGPVTKPQIAP